MTDTTPEITCGAIARATEHLRRMSDQIMAGEIDTPGQTKIVRLLAELDTDLESIRDWHGAVHD